MFILQTIGAALGIVGAILVTSPRERVRFFAFIVWIVSNLLIGIVFVDARLWSLLGMQSVYLVTACLGAWRARPWQPLLGLDGKPYVPIAERYKPSGTRGSMVCLTDADFAPHPVQRGDPD